MRVTIRRKKLTTWKTASKRIKAVRSLLTVFGHSLAAQRHIDLDTAKLSKLAQDRKIGEIEEAIKHDRLVLLDIQIETKKLELMALKRKLGDPDNPFTPEMTRR